MLKLGVLAVPGLQYTQPDIFIQLSFNIGFVGIRDEYPTSASFFDFFIDEQFLDARVNYNDRASSDSSENASKLMSKS